MLPGDIFADTLERVAGAVDGAIDGLTPDELAWRPDPQANSIGWLVWHLTRILDSHVSDLMQREELWTAEGWAERFGLPFPASDTGYGHRTDRVAEARLGADQLGGYHAAVQARVGPWVQGVREGDLGRIVDERWNPPVSLGVRLVSVMSDCLQHAGQAAYLHGLLLRRRGSGAGGPEVDERSEASFPASDPPATY